MDIPQIKKLIVTGQIKTWPDLYGYMTLAEMVETFGRSKKHWEHVRYEPVKMQLQDMFVIVKVLGITREQFYGLVGGGD